jgi:two-component system chemotaxis sensor kinase CheA
MERKHEMNTIDYIGIFLDESREHLQAVNDNILRLEKEPENLQIVNEIFRSAHTLKGIAAMMGYNKITSLTHQMENVLDKIRSNALKVSADLIDTIFLAVEYLEEMVDAISQGKDSTKDVSDLVTQLKQMGRGDNLAEPDKESAQGIPVPMELDENQTAILKQAMKKGYQAKQITVTFADDCVMQAVRAYMAYDVLEAKGELIKTIPVADEMETADFSQGFSVILLSKETEEVIQAAIMHVSEVEHVDIVNYFSMDSVKNPVDDSRGGGSCYLKSRQEMDTIPKTIRVNLERIDDLMNLFEENVIERSRLEAIAQEIDHPGLTETVAHMTSISADMQNLILTMRMVPVEQVFNRFPRMVRGLAKELDKKIKLEISSAETELDRTVIDQIVDPLVHLIRNALDHGIESPAARIYSGKPEEGKLILRAFHSGNHIFIEIEDDGAGINREKVVAKALGNGMITAEQSDHFTDDEIAQLILSSGFSTADRVSDISGRGVGLEVVKNKVELLGGKITIESQQGIGSKFSIKLPLTLSILLALFVEVDGETYAIPLSSVIETVLLDDRQILYKQGQKVMNFRDNVIPLLSLKDLFQITGDQKPDPQYQRVVIVKKEKKMAGIMVDSFIGHQEIVLKTLGNYLGDVFGILGATILGDGKVALIIDPHALFN